MPYRKQLKEMLKIRNMFALFNQLRKQILHLLLFAHEVSFTEPQTVTAAVLKRQSYLLQWFIVF